ncbi:MAG: hypothetical protein HOM52_04930 [Rhodospirillaceae bacterium]|nr:hypothetical protein [Rhodospirillaceae bacterium]
MSDSRLDAGPNSSEPSGRQKAKAPSPWSVRGVSREARAKAAKAASRRRETLGEWVTNALTQIANEELGTGPRRATSESAQAGLPAGPAQDESPLGKALLALAERFEKSEKRNDAISALAQRIDVAESSNREVGAMAEQIGIVEQRSRALTMLVERLETADRREKTLLSLMHSVAERAERGEERITAVTRGLAEMAGQLEAALNRNSARTAQDINQSIMPLESAVNNLSSRISAQSKAPQPAPAAQSASAQYYGTPAGNISPPPEPKAAEAGPETTASAESQDDMVDGGKSSKPLKFDFKALNKRAIENSQRLAGDSDSAPAEEKSSDGGWFGKADSASENDAEDGKAPASDDWAAEALADNTIDHAPQDDHQEPKLENEGRAQKQQPAASEEDEMLMAIKNAIKLDSSN